MTVIEVVEFARRIRDTVRNGLKHAAHWLAARGFSVEFAAWVLLLGA